MLSGAVSTMMMYRDGPGQNNDDEGDVEGNGLARRSREKDPIESSKEGESTVDELCGRKAQRRKSRLWL